jgi:Iap family predicted aminopeptidase
MIVGFRCNCGAIYPPPKRPNGYCNDCRTAVNTADKIVKDKIAEKIQQVRDQLAINIAALQNKAELDIAMLQAQIKRDQKNARTIALLKRYQSTNDT